MGYSSVSPILFIGIAAFIVLAGVIALIIFLGKSIRSIKRGDNLLFSSKERITGEKIKTDAQVRVAWPIQSLYHAWVNVK
jgi:hypothetical protein